MYFQRLIPIESHAHCIGSAAPVSVLFDKIVPCTVQVTDIPRVFFDCYSLSARNVFVTERSILLHNWQSPIFLWLWWLAFVVLSVEVLVVAVVGVMLEDLHVTTWLRYACVHVWLCMCVRARADRDKVSPPLYIRHIPVIGEALARWRC